MTPKEFKSWFEGFTEAFSGMPTKAQWARVKERVAEIDGKETTERVFIDRYWHQPQYYPIYTIPQVTPPTRWVTVGSNTVGSSTVFNPTTAMYALGKNEAAAL